MNNLIFMMQRKPATAEYHYHYQLSPEILDKIVEEIKSELGEVNILQIGEMPWLFERVKVIIQPNEPKNP